MFFETGANIQPMPREERVLHSLTLYKQEV